jgi:signal transduction histidine kinase
LAAIGQYSVLKVKSEGFDPDHVAISVEDTGPGVDIGNMERVFDAFYTTKSRGMGMGLAISRSIVNAHGGTLSVARNAPYGTVFRIALPSSAYAAASASEKMGIATVPYS